MQPAEAEADSAEWAEGQLQPTSQAAESHGSAPSAGLPGGAADTADSAKAGVEPGAEPGADASGADGAGQEEGLQNMQVDAAQELESSMLSKGEKEVACCVLCFVPAHADLLPKRGMLTMDGGPRNLGGLPDTCLPESTLLFCLTRCLVWHSV